VLSGKTLGQTLVYNGRCFQSIPYSSVDLLPLSKTNSARAYEGVHGIQFTKSEETKDKPYESKNKPYENLKQAGVHFTKPYGTSKKRRILGPSRRKRISALLEIGI
jgi:hypothetical protein